MRLESRLQLEREYHDSEDIARGRVALLRGVYASDLFAEAEAYQMDALGDLHGAHVLDYGCGGGYSTVKLRARGAQVTALDISRKRLNEAQETLLRGSAGPPVHFVLGAAEHLPFADAAFDAVFGKQILHHLDVSVAIPEILRVLRPGGRAAFLEPLIHNPLLQAYRRLTPHLRSPTERALSMRDLQRIGADFNSWSHSEFCFLSILPALFEALVSKKSFLSRARVWLQRIDHTLVQTVPVIGRYYWVTVLVLQR